VETIARNWFICELTGTVTPVELLRRVMGIYRLGRGLSRWVRWQRERRRYC